MNQQINIVCGTEDETVLSRRELLGLSLKVTLVAGASSLINPSYSKAFSAFKMRRRRLVTVGPNLSAIGGANSWGNLGVPEPRKADASTNWSFLETGDPVSAAIKTDGTLWTWGMADFLGNSSTNSANSYSPVKIGSLTDWRTVSIGHDFVLAIKTGGTLWSWGYGDYGQLGNGNSSSGKSSPVKIGALTTWSKIVAGWAHALAIQTNGTLWAWGEGGGGRLGDGTVISKSSPVKIGSLTTWDKVATGGNNSYAIKTDGTLWSWGEDSGFSSPVKLGTDSNWSQVFGSNSGHLLGLKTNGELWSWGYNLAGQLGDGTQTYNPVPARVGVDTDWVYVRPGYDCSFALKSNGTLWGWGSYENGVFGYDRVANISTPIQIGTATNWTSFSVSEYKTLEGINSAGELYAWADSRLLQSTPVILGSETNWNQVTVSAWNSFAIKGDGTLWAWGKNYYGCLGDGTSLEKRSPIQIGLGTNWSKFATDARGDSSVAIKTDGTLWAWGNDTATAVQTSTPSQLGSATNWIQVAIGGAGCAGIQANGTLWVWGVNTYGGLADGAVLPSASTPIQVGSLTTWRKVSCGNYYFLALKTNGTLWGWGGENYSGELGIGAGGTGGIHVNTPVQVGTVTTWTDVSAGDYHSLGVRSDGTLWAWGEGSLGQLGSGNVSVSTPIKIGTLTTWSKVATGSSVSYAIKTDKTLWSWGDNTKGPLGAGILGLRSSPVQVGSLNNWISVSAYYVALGIKG